MANTLEVIQDRILAQTLISFQNAAPFLMSANRNYQNEAMSQGTTVDIPKTGSKVAEDVVPSGNRPDALPSSKRTMVQLILNQWKKSSLSLDDKEKAEINAGRDFLPSETQESIYALIESVENNLAGNYIHAYNFTGAPGTTPFASDAGVLIQANKILNDANVPTQNRRFIMDTTTEASALQLPAFADAEKTMENGVKIDAAIGRKYGFFNQVSTNIQTHTRASAGTEILNGAATAGEKTVNMDGFTTKPEAGDLFTIAGHTQQYTVVSSTALSGTASTLTVEPAMVIAYSDGAAATFIDTHVAQLAFHESALTYATRPLSTLVGTNVTTRTLTDPLTGFTVRAEYDRAYKADIIDLDVLYGSAVPQAEAMVRVLR